MSAIKTESAEDSTEHLKVRGFFFLNQEKWKEMNFKIATLKVFEDERGAKREGGRAESQRKWVKSEKG